MAEFILMTDDTCDFPAGYYAENDIAVIKLAYSLDGEIFRAGDKTEKEFYDMIRAGKKPTTMALNAEEVKAVMEPHLQNGKDVLYIAFSSGLSITAQNAAMAVEELKEKYPDRKIILVDSLCASLGEGVLVHKVNQLRKEGMSIDEAAKWATENRMKVAQHFMADDLMHLHRGGRLSKTSAIAGSMLGIKPILHVNDEGKLALVNKARGKKQALDLMADNLAKCVGDGKPDFFAISHADNQVDAEQMAKLLSEKFGIRDYIISYIGPVIGSHTGTGAIAVFMLAKGR